MRRCSISSPGCGAGSAIRTGAFGHVDQVEGVRMAKNCPRYTESGLISTAVALSAAAIDARPLQRLRLRPFKPLKFPAVY